MSPRNEGSSTSPRFSVRRGAGLGELPGDAADLDRGDAAAVGEHDGHLQDDLELVADRVRRERVERLGAVAGLQHEAALLGDRGQRVGEAPRFAREHERWYLAQGGERGVERDGIGPVGLLLRGTRAPGVGRPRLHVEQLPVGVVGSRRPRIGAHR